MSSVSTAMGPESAVAGAAVAGSEADASAFSVVGDSVGIRSDADSIASHSSVAARRAQRAAPTEPQQGDPQSRPNTSDGAINRSSGLPSDAIFGPATPLEHITSHNEALATLSWSCDSKNWKDQGPKLQAICMACPDKLMCLHTLADRIGVEAPLCYLPFNELVRMIFTRAALRIGMECRGRRFTHEMLRQVLEAHGLLTLDGLGQQLRRWMDDDPYLKEMLEDGLLHRRLKIVNRPGAWVLDCITTAMIALEDSKYDAITFTVATNKSLIRLFHLLDAYFKIRHVRGAGYRGNQLEYTAWLALERDLPELILAIAWHAQATNPRRSQTANARSKSAPVLESRFSGVPARALGSLLMPSTAVAELEEIPKREGAGGSSKGNGGECAAAADNSGGSSNGKGGPRSALIVSKGTGSKSAFAAKGSKGKGGTSAVAANTSDGASKGKGRHSSNSWDHASNSYHSSNSWGLAPPIGETHWPNSYAWGNDSWRWNDWANAWRWNYNYGGYWNYYNYNGYWSGWFYPWQNDWNYYNNGDWSGWFYPWRNI